MQVRARSEETEAEEEFAWVFELPSLDKVLERWLRRHRHAGQGMTT